MQSLSSLTPILVRCTAHSTSETYVLNIKDLPVLNWEADEETGTEYAEIVGNLCVWSPGGWTAIKKVSRQVGSASVRIRTRSGIADVIESHLVYCKPKLLSAAEVSLDSELPHVSIATALVNTEKNHVHWWSFEDLDVAWVLGFLCIAGKVRHFPSNTTTFEMEHDDVVMLKRAVITLNRIFPSCVFSVNPIFNQKYIVLVRGHVHDFATQMELVFGRHFTKLPLFTLARLTQPALYCFLQGLGDALHARYSMTYPSMTQSRMQASRGLTVDTSDGRLALELVLLLQILSRQCTVSVVSDVDTICYRINVSGTTWPPEKMNRVISISKMNANRDEDEMSPLLTPSSTNSDGSVYSLYTEYGSYMAGVGTLLVFGGHWPE